MFSYVNFGKGKIMDYKVLAVSADGVAHYHALNDWATVESVVEDFLRAGCRVECWHGNIKFIPSLKGADNE